MVWFERHPYYKQNYHTAVNFCYFALCHSGWNEEKEVGNRADERAGGNICSGWLRTLGLSRLDKRRWGVILLLLAASRGGEAEREMLNYSSCDTACGNRLKLDQGRFRSDIKRPFFTKMVVKHWVRLPREVVNVPNLAMFKCIWTLLLTTHFNFWSALNWSDSWTGWPRFFITEIISSILKSLKVNPD